MSLRTVKYRCNYLSASRQLQMQLAMAIVECNGPQSIDRHFSLAANPRTVLLTRNSCTLSALHLQDQVDNLIGVGRFPMTDPSEFDDIPGTVVW